MALSLSVFELCWLKKKMMMMMNKTPHHSPYIYDARYHAHPYIVSTTVLSDNTKPCEIEE